VAARTAIAGVVRSGVARNSSSLTVSRSAVALHVEDLFGPIGDGTNLLRAGRRQNVLLLKRLEPWQQIAAQLANSIN
jgi:hypothetical protein